MENQEWNKIGSPEMLQDIENAIESIKTQRSLKPDTIILPSDIHDLIIEASICLDDKDILSVFDDWEEVG